jgi:hypothetical protein
MATPPTLAQSIDYMPWGAVSKLVNGYAGSGAPATETCTYNHRLQPCVIQLTTTAQETTAGWPKAKLCVWGIGLNSSQSVHAQEG